MEENCFWFPPDGKTCHTRVLTEERSERQHSDPRAGEQNSSRRHTTSTSTATGVHATFSRLNAKLYIFLNHHEPFLFVWSKDVYSVSACINHRVPSWKMASHSCTFPCWITAPEQSARVSSLRHLGERGREGKQERERGGGGRGVLALPRPATSWLGRNVYFY